MPSLKIKTKEDEEIIFPVPEDRKLMLNDIRDAFPDSTGLRYKDDGCTAFNHVLCRDGVFLEPQGGWEKQERIYFLVKHESSDHCSRLSRFENYRQELETNRNKSAVRRRKGAGDGCSGDSDGTVKIHVGRGHFQNGGFKRLTANSLGGGIVLVGPFPKHTNCVTQIRDEAFKKFHSMHRCIRKKMKLPEQMTLVYPDGTKVINLPDGSDEFTIKGYRDFLDPNKKYDRLRLYPVDTDQLDNEIEIRSEESSDSLPDPFSDTESKSISQLLRDEIPRNNNNEESEHEMQIQNYTSQCSPLYEPLNQGGIEMTNDTIPLEVTVHFVLNGVTIATEKFAHNLKIENLVLYIKTSGLYQAADSFDLVMNETILEVSSHLFEYCTNLNENLQIEVRPLSETRQREIARFGRNRLSLRRSQTTQLPASVAADNSNDDNSVQSLEDYDDLSDLSMEGILKWWVERTKVSCEPQLVLVNRMQILKSTLRVVTREDYNFCKDFNITFSGEDGDDQGGPKREFFRLLMEEVAGNIFQGSFFMHNIDKLFKHEYEMAGSLLAFSILHGGPGLPMLHESIYDFMVDQEPCDYPIIKDCIVDHEIRERLEKIEKTETDETYQSALSEISDWCCERGLSILPYKNFTEKERLIQVILKNETIYSVHAEIDQFRRGLNRIGRFFDAVMLAPAQFKPLFCKVENKPLTFRELRGMYRVQFSEEGSNLRRLENQAHYCLEAYLADCEGGATGVTLPEVLGFWTGATNIPPLGFPKALEVTFGAAKQFPTAHTCSMELNIWRGYDDADVFQEQMNKAIRWSGGFHLA